MVLKKKYLGGLSILLALLFLMLFSSFSTSFATSNLTPINHMTPAIFHNILDYIKDNNLAYSVSNSNGQTVFNDFYSRVSEESIETLCQSWNSLDFSGKAEYLEQCMFVFGIPNNNTNIQISVFFSNNTYGNVGYHLKFWKSNTYNVTFQYLNDNLQPVSGSRLVFYCRQAGVITTPSFIDDVSTSGLQYFATNVLINTTSNPNRISLNNLFSYHFAGSVYYSNSFYLLNTNYIVEQPPEPEPPQPELPSGDGSLGNITDSNGNSGGNINLEPLHQGLTNIQNQISGDTHSIINHISGETQKVINTLTDIPNISDTKIISGDIIGALDFDFMADPYSNFWLNMTTGLSGSLTNTVRQIPVNLLGYQGLFDLDNLGFNYPPTFKFILTSASTVSMVWLLVKWWKIIINKLTSGNMDEVLAMNDEERHYRFILRGCKND